MDKETLLQLYIDIESNTFRTDKIKKLDELITNIRQSGFTLSLADTLSIVEHLTQNNITIRHPLFLHVIYPVLTKAIDQENIDAIKSLLHLVDYFGGYYKLIKDNRFLKWGLLTKGLQLKPDDHELLTRYEKEQRDYFEYTLHELPSGVLYENNGASIPQCEELLNEISEYEKVCKKLQIDQQELIDECKFYYTSHKDYLASHKNYKGFSGYLELHDKYK